MSKSRWKVSPCPLCGRPERHDVSMKLAQCSMCVMGISFVDWVKTFERLKAEAHYSQRDIASLLDVSPQTITEIMAGRLKVSPELSAKIRRKFPEYLVAPTPEAKEGVVCAKCGHQVHGQAKYDLKTKSFRCLRCPSEGVPTDRAKIQQKGLVRQLA